MDKLVVNKRWIFSIFFVIWVTLGIHTLKEAFASFICILRILHFSIFVVY